MFLLIPADLLFVAFFIFIRQNYISALIFSLLILPILIIGYHLESCTIENSGEVFTVKHRHPYFKNKWRNADLPVNKISGFKFEKLLYGYLLILKISKENSSKKIKLYFPLYGFSARQVKVVEGSIISSLDDIN